MADKIVHTIHLDRYAPMPAQIQLGTVESYGVEQIAVVVGAGWDGLDIVAVYHPPKAAEPVRVIVPSDGLSDVPPEATASAGRGALVIAGMADGVQIASCNIAYTVIAQAGTDGTTSDAPTPDLVQQILSAANGAVKTADGVRADMDKVLEAESGRETAEADRVAAESERVNAEAARAEAEADRASTEQSRVKAESARVTAETARAKAETKRASAEQERQTAEQGRVEAESSRVKVEAEREKQLPALHAAVSELKEDIGHLSESKISKFYASNQGETHLADSDNGKIVDMMLYGKSSQDGTPTPTNPIEIKSVVNATVNVLNEDGTESQAVTIPYTLNAIPVSSGGNVTIAGQQYIADYVDVEKGKLYRKVKRLDLKDIDNTAISHGFHSNGNGYMSISIENAVRNGQCTSNKYRFAKWTPDSGYVYIPNASSIVIVDDRFTDKQTAIELSQDVYFIYELKTPIEDGLSTEQIKSLKSLSTNYPVTNITVGSEELDGYAVFNYPISMANGWNYVKQQLNDNRDYIYNMDTQNAEAYVNSEYAVALTELEV